MSCRPFDRNISTYVFSAIPLGCVRAPYALVLNERVFFVCVISCAGRDCVAGVVSLLLCVY